MVVIRPRVLRFALVGVILIGCAGVVFPASHTASAFTDVHNGSAEFAMAGGPGGGGNLPNNAVAYDDVDGDLEYDDGEPTYKESDLRNFDNESVDLVIPNSDDTISRNGNNGISIRAGSITSRAEITTDRGDLTLEATEGTVDVESSRVAVDSGSGALSVTASDGITATDASLSTQDGNLLVDAGSDAVVLGATVNVAGGGTLDIQTNGELTGDDAGISSTTGRLTITSGSQATLDGASINTSEGYTPLAITASSISGTNADFETASGAMNLEATAGTIDVDDATLRISQNGRNVDLSATQDVSAAAATLTTQDGDVVIEADGVTTLDDATVTVNEDNGASRVTSGEILANGASVTTVRSDVDWSTTDGQLALGNADVTVSDQNGNIELASAGDLTTSGSTLGVNRGGLTLDSGGQATLTDARVDIEEGSQSATVSAGSVVAENVHVTTSRGGIDWTASNAGIDADGGNFTVRDQNGGVQLEAEQEIALADGVLDVRAGTQPVNVTAGSLDADNLSAFTVDGDVELQATDGGMSMIGGNVTVREKNGGISLAASKEAVLDDSLLNVRGGYEPATVSAESVTAGNSTVLTANGDIGMSATDGDIDIKGGNMTVREDGGAITVDATGLATLDDSVMDIRSGYEPATVSAASVRGIDTSILTGSGEIAVTATDEGIDLHDGNVTVRAGNDGIDIDAPGPTDLSNAVLTTAAESIEVSSAQTVSLDASRIDIRNSYSNVNVTGATLTANDSNVDTASGSIELNAIANGGGSLSANDATLNVNQDSGTISLASRGDMSLNSSLLQTAEGNSLADLGDASSTLFVYDTNIEGGDGNVTYSPSGVEVRPNRDDVLDGS